MRIPEHLRLCLTHVTGHDHLVESENFCWLHVGLLPDLGISPQVICADWVEHCHRFDRGGHLPRSTVQGR